MYEETTRNIRVSVEPNFLEEESIPEDHVFVWAYRIKIENHGTEPVQLRNRYWHIIDELGRVQEVHGRGVVGEEPVLQPGELFEYTSGVHLTAGSGMMAGNYKMQTFNGDAFDVHIPPFSLDSPHHLQTVQ